MTPDNVAKHTPVFIAIRNMNKVDVPVHWRYEGLVKFLIVFAGTPKKPPKHLVAAKQFPTDSGGSASYTSLIHHERPCVTPQLSPSATPKLCCTGRSCHCFGRFYVVGCVLTK